MTVTAVTPNVQYTITSANVSSLADSHTSVTFAVTFKYLATSEVVVTKTRAGVDTTLTETTHYTLSAAGASGTMTFTDAGAALFAADDLITFTRSMALSQATDYAVNDLLDAETLEQNFDKAAMISQQLNEEISRQFSFAATATFDSTAAAASTVTGTKDDRASKFLAFDADGDVTLSAATSGILSTSGAAAGHILRYTGSLYTTSSILALDDTKLYFGTDSDVSIEYDAAGDNTLLFQANVEGAGLNIGLYADEGDDNADKWRLSVADGGTVTLDSKISGSFVSHFTIAPDATITSSSVVFPGHIELGHATDTTLSRASAGEVNIEGNRIYRAGGTDVAVADGGTGASSLTDGGVLLGSGTGAITPMGVLSDGQMIVGNGSTDPVAESGGTLRTSIGVGTGDSPELLGLSIGPDADGTDRTITFGHTTLKTVIGIDDSGDVFAINTDNAFEAANDLQIDASGNVTAGNGSIYTGTAGKIYEKGGFSQRYQSLILGY